MAFSVFLSLLPLRNPGQRPGQQQVPWGTQTKTWSGLENTFLGDGCRFESRGVSETPQWFRRHWDSGRYRRGQVQISEILTGVTNPKENPYFLYRCTVNCLSHIRSDCLLCLSLCPHSHLVVNTPAGLFLPPFFSPPPHPTHIAATRLSFWVYWQIHRGCSTNMPTVAAFYFISWTFHFLSDLGFEHSPFASLMHLCEVFLHFCVPLKPVPLASLSIKPVHFASPHVGGRMLQPLLAFWLFMLKCSTMNSFMYASLFMLHAVS